MGNINRIFKLFILFSLFWFFPITAVYAISDPEVFEVIESNDSRLIIAVKPFNISFDEKNVGGERFELPQIDGFQWLTEPGKPQLPMKGVLVGIPENATPIVQILESQLTPIGVKNIYPTPKLILEQGADEQYLVEQFYIDRNSYVQNNFYPMNLAEITNVTFIRDQRVARLEIRPLLYNPSTKELLKVEQLKIALIFNSDQNPDDVLIESRPIKSQGPYVSLYEKMLINYETTRKWQQSKPVKITTIEQAEQWYNPNLPYFKLFIEEDGIYQLDYSYLQGIGIDVNLINPVTLQIFNKGKEIPLYVKGQEDGQFDQEDYLEFYGQRNAGDTTYYDLYTDTNVYWLSWGGEPGLRMNKKNSASEAGIEVNDYVERIHLEQDNVYHHGDNSLDTIEMEDVEGEGWVWRFFFAGDKETIKILANSIAESERPSKIRVKLRGTTLDPVRPNHHIKILLNDVELGNFYFNGTDVYIFEADFSSLKEGENKLVIQSVGDTGAQIDQIYLDWIELEYPRQLVAENDYLEFDVSDQDGSLSQFKFWNFSDPNVHIFDLTHHAVIEDASINIGQRLFVKVTSAANQDGNFSRFYLNSQQVGVSGSRGHNLVAIDEVTGQVVETKNFDTHQSTAESDSMAQYIQRLPQGRIVLAAIRDEGSRYMTENAYLALESMGSQYTRNVGYRDSWTMVGIKGAQPGDATEQWTQVGTGFAMAKDTLILTGSGTNYYVTFGDTLAQSKKYVAVSERGVKYPKAAELDIFTDIKSIDSGADLVIIAHKRFINSANRLAEYRASHNGLRVKVVDVQEIYDEFNYGLLNPGAIKDFLKYAYDYWQAPAPSYLILFGDASWDFKKNLGEDVKENYIPSYGNPVSDNWFVCFDGKGDFLPEMFVGRIPVESVEQAEIVVDKIIAYENTPTGNWKKNVLFITGGFNKSEQRTFMNQTTFLISNYVTPPPASCRALQINKTTEGYFEGEKKAEILEAVDRGAVWLNFLGHAGSRTWDLMFNHPDIEELSNQDKYPFITSMTCHTGRFANPQLNSFGEHFVITGNKGAIGFWGTTGWGYVFQDNILLRNLFFGALVDTIHSLGQATTFAKIKLWESYGGGIYNESTIHQYTLLGDPITDLTLPEKPDLTIGTGDVSFTPAALSEADSVAIIKIKIQNWGMAARDTFNIDIYDIQNIRAELIASNVPVPFVGLVDSVSVPWDLKDKAGEHTIRVVLDVQDEIDEVDEDNNSQEFPIFVYSSKISVSRPFEFQVISPKDVILQVNNPAIAPAVDSPRYYQFELDTTESFDSPVLMTSSQISEGTIVTRWTMAELRDETTFFWRCRTVDGIDVGNWVTASFTTQSSIPENTWSQKHRHQLKQNHFNQAEISNQGLQLETCEFIIKVESAGLSDGNYARATVNSVPVMEQHRGHNLVVISSNSGEVITNRSFDTWDSPDEANAMASFINSLSEGMYVLCAIKDDGSYNMTEAAYQALESIGSQYCRDVGFRDSWAIVGVKGAPIGSVKERRNPTGQGIATVQDTLINYYPQGTVTSTPIGPADGWKHVSCNQDVSASGTNVVLDVIGFNKKLSQWDTLLIGLSNFRHEDLSPINARNYPLIKLQAKLSDDDGSHTPFLRDWLVSYVPVADPAIGYEVVTFSSDTLMEGDNLNINLQVFNVGMKIVDSVKIRFSVNMPDSGKVTIGDEKILTNIQIGDFQAFSQSWESSGRMGNTRLFIEVDPDNQVNELTESNNYYSRNIYVLPDSMKPQVQVTYDGKQIITGDYVSSQPIILINVYDNSQFLSENDTTKINLFLNNNRISYSANKNELTIAPINNIDEPGLKAQVRFTPELKDGDHSFEIFVKDARNNFTYHRDDFQVTSDFKILNVFNYPNPFSDGTEFTFNLTQPSDKVSIKIFTVAGRLIRTLAYHHLEAGFHHLYWNGLDQDRNDMANGVYLYKVVARSGDKQVEQIEKLVIMR